MRYNFGHSPISRGSFTGVIKWLIIINVAVFFIQRVAGVGFLKTFSLIPIYVTKKIWIWQLVTYMFLHAGFFHLLINLFVLWMFGKSIATVWGNREFLKYYLICGIGAAVLTVITGPFTRIPTIGASGGVYGVLLAFGMLYPESVIYLYFLIPIKAKHFVILMGALTFISSINSTGSQVAHFAHLGGLLTGYIYLKSSSLRHKFSLGTLKTINTYKIAEFIYKLKMFFSHNKKPSAAGPAGPVSENNVNEILDKILLHGIESLTPEEKQIMQKYITNKERQ